MKHLIWLLAVALYSHSSNGAVVAVVDSGVDIQHVDLKDNLWTNLGEFGKDSQGNDKSLNGVDDDRNGFVDDLHGWDFVLNQSAKIDPTGHGTHISGLIATTPKIQIMSLRYFDKDQTGAQNLSKSIAAIQYAVKMGADMINYSGGGPTPDGDEKAALKMAAEENILVIAAAGNEARELGARGFFPATYGFSNILAVASVNSTGQLSRHSNFSHLSVHLAALGDAVTSTLPNNKHGTMSGTSQATAIVSGAAAKLMDLQPNLRRNPSQLIVRLMNLGVWNPLLIHSTASSAIVGNNISPNSLGSDVDAFGQPLAL